MMTCHGYLHPTELLGAVQCVFVMGKGACSYINNQKSEDENKPQRTSRQMKTSQVFTIAILYKNSDRRYFTCE